MAAACSINKTPLKMICNGAASRGDALNLQEVTSDASIPFLEPVPAAPSDAAMMPYSSGTTGAPKGVAISHSALTSNLLSYTQPNLCPTPSATPTEQPAYACVLPFSHVYGLLPVLLAGFYKGIKLLTMPVFNPATFVDLIQQHRCSTLHLVPPLLNFLLHHPSAEGAKLRALTHVLASAAPVSPTVVAGFKEKLGRDIVFQEGYGMTETLLTHIVPVDADVIGTCGKVLPNVEARIVCPDTGKNLPAGEKGEILVRTPGVMSGYYKNPAATAETLDEEGWVSTGDVGTYDDGEFFRIVDRTKELIKVKGLQVSNAI